MEKVAMSSGLSTECGQRDVEGVDHSLVEAGVDCRQNVEKA